MNIPPLEDKYTKLQNGYLFLDDQNSSVVVKWEFDNTTGSYMAYITIELPDATSQNIEKWKLLVKESLNWSRGTLTPQVMADSYKGVVLLEGYKRYANFIIDFRTDTTECCIDGTNISITALIRGLPKVASNNNELYLKAVSAIQNRLEEIISLSNIDDVFKHTLATVCSYHHPDSKTLMNFGMVKPPPHMSLIRDFNDTSSLALTRISKDQLPPSLKLHQASIDACSIISNIDFTTLRTSPKFLMGRIFKEYWPDVKEWNITESELLKLEKEEKAFFISLQKSQKCPKKIYTIEVNL